MIKFLFTAAHCFQYKEYLTPLEPANVNVLIGRYNLSNQNEVGSKIVSVQKIILHPDWDIRDVKYDSDIAIVVLAEAMEFGDQIQPICLPDASNREPVGHGTVTGWGQSSVEAFNDETPNKLVMPVINASYCYTKFPKLADYASHRTFCAGFENQERGSCAGDSGGGFFIKDSKDFYWKVHGIVSGSLVGEKYGCDVNSFGIYTNVGVFRNWIDQEIGKTRDTIKLEDVEIQCGGPFP